MLNFGSDKLIWAFQPDIPDKVFCGQPRFQAVSICPPASLCPRWFGYIPHNPVNPFYLLVDILFYGALVVGIMTGYKATIIV